MKKTWNDLDICAGDKLLVKSIQTREGNCFYHGNPIMEITIELMSEKAVKTKEFGWLPKNYMVHIFELL